LLLEIWAIWVQIGRVSTLGIPVWQRIVSRIGFYVLVALAMWATGRLQPDWSVIEVKRWEARGVVPPLIAVPLSDLTFDPERAVDTGSD